jgi:hypothetical protein
MFLLHFSPFISSSPSVESPNDNHKTINDSDPILHLLNQQLQGVHTSLLVCKWPVTLMSCFFVTLLCWDMAGDKGGWLQAVWVPIVGVVMSLAIWVCDRLLIGAPHWSCTSFCPNHRQSSPSLRIGTELVNHFLHQSAPEDLGKKSHFIL